MKSALDDVFQFADIAGPVVAAQRVENRWGCLGDGFVVFAVEFFQKGVDQNGNVFFAFAQGGDGNGEDIEPVKTGLRETAPVRPFASSPCWWRR